MTPDANAALWRALDDEWRRARDLADKAGVNRHAAGSRLRALVRREFAAATRVEGGPVSGRVLVYRRGRLRWPGGSS